MLTNLNLKKINNIKLVIIFLAISNCLIIGCSSKVKDAYASLSAKDIYDKGKNNIIKGKFNEAVLDFEALESNYPYGEYTDRAKLSLMYAYYSKKDFLQSKATADRFVHMYPRHKYVDYAYYMQGLAGYCQYYSTIYKLFKLDRSKREPNYAIESFDSFKCLLERFPKSRYSLDAHKRMVHLRNQIALHELEIAKYYIAKKAYIAAINRCKNIITNFDQTTAVKEALELMINAYKDLSMPELEKKVTELLKENKENFE